MIARNEERAANTGRSSEQRAALPESARDEERPANTGRRSEQREALPESARDEERPANTGRRSEQREALPESAMDEERDIMKQFMFVSSTINYERFAPSPISAVFIKQQQGIDNSKVVDFVSIAALSVSPLAPGGTTPETTEI